MSLASEALGDVLAAYGRNGEEGHAVVLVRAAQLWPRFDPANEDAEECVRAGEVYRRAAIAAVKTNQTGATTWRSRSLAMFALGSSRNGVAMVILANALRDLSEGNKEACLDQISLMHLLADDDDAVVSSSIVRSAAFENEGIARLDPRGGDPDPEGARRALEQARPLEEAAGDHRRALKLRASMTTADYLAARPGDTSAAQAGLESVLDEANAAGIAADVVDIGEQNLALMREGADRLLPYQVI